MPATAAGTAPIRRCFFLFAFAVFFTYKKSTVSADTDKPFE
jgi:hypothetical protein